MKNLKLLLPALFSFKTRSRKVKLIVVGSGVLLLLLLGGTGVVAYENHQALQAVKAAQQLDKQGKYQAAQARLKRVKTCCVLPSTKKKVLAELAQSRRWQADHDKLEQAKELAKTNPEAAQKLLESIDQSSPLHDSAVALKQTTQQKASSGNKTAGSSGSTTGSGGTSTGGGSGGTGGSGGGSSGGGSGGGGGTPTPPGPMTQITINSFSATSSANNASSCHIADAVNFSVNGSGSVSVTWKHLSTKSSSGINNPVSYSFSGAGSQSDGGNNIYQGLESGDSYKVSVTITSGSITQTAGPVTISSCAAPPALMSPNQPSFMASQVSPGALSVLQNADPIFVNECSMNVRAPFSVSGPGSVQVVYTITSASSGGATLYASQQWSFSGPGSATDSSYIRMPHLVAGDHYTITAVLNVLGDPAHSASASTITSGCS